MKNEKTMMTSITNLNHLLAIGQAPNGWIWTMAIGFALISLIMMLVVLIQKPKGGGLSGAFGGGAGGGSESAFIGGRVGDVLTWTTVICFVLFLLLAMGMTWGIKGGGSDPAKDKPAEEQVDRETPDTGVDANDGAAAGAGADATDTSDSGDSSDPAEDQVPHADPEADTAPAPAGETDTP